MTRFPSLLIVLSLSGPWSIGPAIASGVLPEVAGPFQPAARQVDLRSLPKVWTGPPAGRLRDAEPEQEKELKERRGNIWSRGVVLEALKGIETQRPAPTLPAGGFGAATPNVPGINFANVVPADPNGDAGPNHYVQAVNGATGSLMSVFDKTTGAIVAGPINLSQLSSGDCAGSDTDPQVIHDGLAGRWLLARLASGKLCVLMSSGNDPVNTVWTEINPVFDRLALYTVQPDFANPAQSVFSGPQTIVIGDVQLAANRFPAQPGGVALPAFTGTLMHRTTYRNLGDREVIMLSSNAATGTFSGYGDPELGARTGVLWFELERIGGVGQPWTVSQQELFGPNDGVSRFMSALNVDNAGNLALGYAVTGEASGTFPGLRYTGRRRTDPTPGMTLIESTLASGVAAQTFTGASQRWGDYFDMSLDPDGCRFWFTGQYMDDTNWGTRVASFRHDDCGPPDFAWSGDSAVAKVCGLSNTILPPRALQLQSRYGYWRDLTLSFDALPQGVSASVTPQQLRPSGSATAQLSVAAGTPAGLVVPRLVASDGTLTHTFDLPIDVDQPSAVPALSEPANAAVQQPSIVRLSWAPTAGADDYVVDVATDAAFTPPLDHEPGRAGNLCRYDPARRKHHLPLAWPWPEHLR
ncbi:MAG: hypothetical protein IPK97_15830 [Ahniella sp.]|nr:hypothetical protein [Ahniella sp.]